MNPRRDVMKDQIGTSLDDCEYRGGWLQETAPLEGELHVAVAWLFGEGRRDLIVPGRLPIDHVAQGPFASGLKPNQRPRSQERDRSR
jgi:hypothetical protein